MREFYGLGGYGWDTSLQLHSTRWPLHFRLQSKLAGLPAWQSGQPGQVGNQAALTVESVPGVRLANFYCSQPRNNSRKARFTGLVCRRVTPARDAQVLGQLASCRDRPQLPATNLGNSGEEHAEESQIAVCLAVCH